MTQPHIWAISPLYRLGAQLIAQIINDWLNLPDIGSADIAMMGNDDARQFWLESISLAKSSYLANMTHHHFSIKWFTARRILISKLVFNFSHHTWTWAALRASSLECLNQPSLLSITFEGIEDFSYSIPQEVWMHIGKSCPGLKILHVGMCYAEFDSVARYTALNDAALEHIGDGCPNLHTFRINLHTITDAGFSRFVNKCTKLQDVKIEICGDLSDVGVASLAAACGNTLRRLDFHSHKSKLTCIGLNSVAMGCCDLKELHLNGCRAISDNCVKLVIERNPNLTKFTLSGTNLTDVSVIFLAEHCRRLQEFNAYACRKITSVGVKKLAECCLDLSVVDLSENEKNFTGSTIISVLVRGCPNLLELRLSAFDDADDNDVIAIADHCSQLRLIEIGWTDLTDVGLKALARGCVMLEYVEVSCTDITDSGVISLAESCPLLKELHLFDCVEITDTGVLTVFERCPALLKVDLSGTSVTEDCRASLLRAHPKCSFLYDDIYLLHEFGHEEDIDNGIGDDEEDFDDIVEGLDDGEEDFDGDEEERL